MGVGAGSIPQEHRGGHKRKLVKVNYQPLADINITALVDVTLVLLIIFMVAAPMLKNSVDVAVPQASTAESTSDEGITVTIKKDGSILIDQTKVDDSSFDMAFEQTYGSSKEPVFLQADAEVPYQKVLHVIDVLRQVGVTELGLIADPMQSRTGRRQ